MKENKIQTTDPKIGPTYILLVHLQYHCPFTIKALTLYFALVMHLS